MIRRTATSKFETNSSPQDANQDEKRCFAGYPIDYRKTKATLGRNGWLCFLFPKDGSYSQCGQADPDTPGLTNPKSKPVLSMVEGRRHASERRVRPLLRPITSIPPTPLRGMLSLGAMRMSSYARPTLPTSGHQNGHVLAALHIRVHVQAIAIGDPGIGYQPELVGA